MVIIRNYNKGAIIAKYQEIYQEIYYIFGILRIGRQGKGIIATSEETETRCKFTLKLILIKCFLFCYNLTRFFCILNFQSLQVVFGL